MENIITDIENIKNTLDEYGVAIIPNILDKEECSNFESGMFDYLEHVTQKFEVPIDRNNPETFKEWYKLIPKHGMLQQHFWIGHAQFNWDLRMNPKLINVFKNIYDTDDLLVSFDGASFAPPHEITKRGYYKNNNWLHVDQSYLRNDFECIQSWVTAKDVNEGDATLTVLVGSHNLHKECAKEFGIENKDDWYKLCEEQLNFYRDNGCEKTDITCPAGSLVLWDSRTVHSGKEALKTRKKDNMRIVSYLCYTPRIMASKKVIEKRIEAFENMRTTSHWPHKCTLFPKNPRTYGNPLPNDKEIDFPVLNKIGMKLVGYDMEEFIEEEKCILVFED